MSYSAEGHQKRINYFSNPRMILPESGTRLGVWGESDNAAVLTRNRFRYAATGDESGQCGGSGGGGGKYKYKHIIIPTTKSQLSEEKGEIQSPNYPAAYPHNKDQVNSA